MARWFQAGDLLETRSCLELNRLKLQDGQYAQMPTLTWFRWIYLAVYFSVATAFTIFGTMTLMQGGFLRQNIIYWLIEYN
jgi:hypothetical protein